jgi:small subunit ribosomal protein S13
MVRFFGLMMPDDKRIAYALTLLYGMGWTNSNKVLKQVGIDTHKKVKDLTEEDIKKITGVIETTYKVEGDLKEAINENIKRLRDIGSYRGIRHVRGLPVRGQRTRSNARTKRGKRKTVGALRKEVWAKLEQGKTGGSAEAAAPAAKPAGK